jgi:hypothetical protein
MWVGVFLICVGILIILGNMGILQGDVWGYILPVFFILLGASILFKSVKKSKKADP